MSRWRSMPGRRPQCVFGSFERIEGQTDSSSVPSSLLVRVSAARPAAPALAGPRIVVRPFRAAGSPDVLPPGFLAFAMNPASPVAHGMCLPLKVHDVTHEEV